MCVCARVYVHVCTCVCVSMYVCIRALAGEGRKVFAEEILFGYCRMRRSFLGREAEERHARLQVLSSQGLGDSNRTLPEASAASSLPTAISACGNLLAIGCWVKLLCQSLPTSHTFSGKRCFIVLG